jgi:hypothetical protein
MAVSIFLATILLNHHFYILAQTEKISSSPAVLETSSPTDGISDDNIKSLKDKIATKVAELRQQNKKIVTGVVNKKEQEVIELKSDEKIFKVTTDDVLTKIYSLDNNSLKEIKIEDLKKDDFIIVLGPLIEDSISANYIYKDQPYVVGSGKVTEVNNSDYSLKIITQEKDEYILDIELSTKQQILDIKTLKTNPSGFSKIKEGDSIHFVFKKPKEEKFTRVSALRILIIPQEYFVMK